MASSSRSYLANRVTSECGCLLRRNVGDVQPCIRVSNNEAWLRLEEGLLDLVLHATVALRHHLVVGFLVLLIFLFLLTRDVLNFIFGWLVLNCPNKHDQLLSRKVVDIEFLRETLQECKKIRVLLLRLLLLLLGLWLGLLQNLRLRLSLNCSVCFCLYSWWQLRLSLLLRERILRLLQLLLLVLTLSDLLLLRQAYLLGVHILLDPLVSLLRVEAELLVQRGVI
jgi:hypothetical protein